MRTFEERQRLIEVAQELIRTLKEITRPVNEICCKLDSEIMQMGPKAIAEKDGKQEQRSEMHKAKRACSVCRQPGHRAKNCPHREGVL